MTQASGTGRTRQPSPPWVGGLMCAFLFGGSAWLLAYTLLAVPFIEALGPWNYVIVLGCFGALSMLSSSWQGDRPDPDEGTSPPEPRS